MAKLKISKLPHSDISAFDAPNLPKFSLVVPTYNESKNISALIKIVSGLLDKVLPNDYELIIVDDDSPDHTWELAMKLMTDYPRLKVIRRQGEKGLSTAVIRGWQAARGDFLGVMDGDLQHPPGVLEDLLKAMDNGVDLAVASRHVEGGGVSDWSAIRRLISRGAQLIGLALLPEVLSRVSDPMSGYFTVRREAIEEQVLGPLGYKILIEVLARGKVERIAEVGYVFQERKQGSSKITWQTYVEYLLHLVKLRFVLQSTRRFIKFCAVGFSGVFVDMGVLFLLSDPRTLGWGVTGSKVIAAELALINNFIWNDIWTFGDISKKQPGAKQWFTRLLKFNVICLIGLIINVAVLSFLFKTAGMNRYLANLTAIGVATFWNFLVNVKFSWRAPKVV